MTISIPGPLHSRLSARAAAEGAQVAEHVRIAVREYLDRLDEKEARRLHIEKERAALADRKRTSARRKKGAG